MKQVLSLIFVLSVVLSINSCKKDDVVAQPDDFMAPTVPTKRNVLIEDFTGVRLGFAPETHNIARSIYSNNQGKVFVIGWHVGEYASPMAGWPDYTSSYGDSIVAQASVSGFPSGTINRLKASDLDIVPQTPGGMAINRNDWSAAASKVMAMNAPVNLAAKAVFNSSDRKLTVRVDAYFSALDSTDCYLHIALVQDKLVSKQEGAENPMQYEHYNVLRDLLTGLWGDLMPEPSGVGYRFSKTYTYTLPENYNGTGTEGGGAVVLSDLRIVTFVTYGKANVVQVAECPVQQ